MQRVRGSCIISSISVKHKIIHQHTWAWPMWHQKKPSVGRFHWLNPWHCLGFKGKGPENVNISHGKTTRLFQNQRPGHQLHTIEHGQTDHRVNKGHGQGANKWQGL